MKKSYGFMIVFAACIIAALFIFTTFVSIKVKAQEREVTEIYQKIDEMRIEIKRVKIESSALTNPLDVLDYAAENEMKQHPKTKWLKSKTTFFTQTSAVEQDLEGNACLCVTWPVGQLKGWGHKLIHYSVLV